ncbi:hypothetical protein GCM10009565_39050 [Amycolatopsis albidoflavus]
MPNTDELLPARAGNAGVTRGRTPGRENGSFVDDSGSEPARDRFGRVHRSGEPEPLKPDEHVLAAMWGTGTYGNARET